MNNKVFDANGRFLGFCSDKKYNWFIKKGLTANIDQKILYLNFVPSFERELTEYEKYALEHACVVCGTKDNLTKHHIVPKKYRKHFPDKFKRHLSHDVVLICEKHHREYEYLHAARLHEIISDLYQIEVGHGSKFPNQRKNFVNRINIKKFIILWRKHFIESMNPKFMPVGWNINYSL